MKKLIFSIIAGIAALTVNADDCDLHIQVVTPDTEMSAGDSSVGELLAVRLTNVLTATGVTADENYGQFYISGRFTDLYKETTQNAPIQTVVTTDLTLMVADIFGNKVFDSETFELRGVGTSQQRAYINAIRTLTKDNKRLSAFVDRARRKVITYFDNNYKSLLSKAATAAATNDYDQALYFAGLIPTCCVGYPEAEQMMLKYYQSDINRKGVILLNQAKSEFAISPNAEGAARAYALLNQIDPSSSAYSAAQSFANEVKKQTKVEYDFEVHQKYTDARDITMKQIDAARQVGIAYGKGQKATTTNILWH